MTKLDILMISLVCIDGRFSKIHSHIGNIRINKTIKLCNHRDNYRTIETTMELKNQWYS